VFVDGIFQKSRFWIAREGRPIHNWQNVNSVVYEQFDGGRFTLSANICLAPDNRIADRAQDLQIGPAPQAMFLFYRTLLPQ